jgi:cobalt-zinc-cadmium resistance protein CzcA
VILVLFALLGSLRAGLIVAATVPLSVLGAAVGMVLFGIPGNLMSLGAIDFGLGVDGSDVVVEQIFVRGADLGQVVAAAEGSVRRSVDLPRGYQLTWGGQYEVLQAAVRRLSWVIPTVLLSILALLVLAFRRLRPSLLIFSHVPFAGVGGVVALRLRGLPLSMSAAVGFIALSGIAVLNGVVLVSRVLANEAAGMEPAQAATHAAQGRVRPVLMTALVAALNCVPMVLATGVGAEVQRPLATVVVSGLTTSTLLTLFALPAVYPALRRPFGR